jgi:hypothetical protein
MRGGVTIKEKVGVGRNFFATRIQVLTICFGGGISGAQNEERDLISEALLE